MDITKIQAAIADMPKQPVQGGKQYTMVAQRVEAFRKHIGADLGIETELISNTDQRVLMKASIKTPSGFVVSTGYAEEVRGSTHINKGSALENCETSAVGRALAALGLHGGEYASVNEIEKHNRNMDAAHDQAVREEREAVVQAPASPGGVSQGISDPADDIPWPEDKYRNFRNKDWDKHQVPWPEPGDDKLWQTWIDHIKIRVSEMKETWQIKTLGQEQTNAMKSLRQYNTKWADELVAYISVRWEQLNQGER